MLAVAEDRLVRSADAEPEPCPRNQGSATKRIGSLAMKLAIAVALGYALYMASLINERPQSSAFTAPSQPLDATKQVSRARTGSVPSPEQRRIASESVCAGETWPNISPECVKGRSEPAPARIEPMTSAEKSSGTLLRPTNVASSDLVDPIHTGSLPTAAAQPTSDAAPRALKGSSGTRVTRSAARSRSHSYAARPARRIRVARRPSRSAAHAQFYPRQEYTPWWVPFWR